MSKIANVVTGENYISVNFDVEDKVLEIGEHMNELCDEAYMNGYNWEAFLNHYLEINAPEILSAIDTDSEAGMYSAYFNDVTEENKALAERYAEIINGLFENEDEIYSFLEDNAGDIEWD